MSSRPIDFKIARVLYVVLSKGALPYTVLIPSKLAAGDLAASNIANASSWPVSQSSQMGVRGAGWSVFVIGDQSMFAASRQ